jgi:hypothetical protein
MKSYTVEDLYCWLVGWLVGWSVGRSVGYGLLFVGQELKLCM